MPRQSIDLSVPLENDVPADPPGYGPFLSYHDHAEGAVHLADVFPRLRPEDLPEGQGWAFGRAQISTHNGTHMDAP